MESDKANPYGKRAVYASLGAFLLGRGISALLTFSAFVLAARLLSLTEYGVYAAALALAELGLALATGGLDWVVIRVVPEYRQHADGIATVKMICRLAALQSSIFIGVGSIVYFAAPVMAPLLQIDDAEQIFCLAGLLIAIEGVARLGRDQMLGVLMLQKAGQLAQIARAGSVLLQLLCAYFAARLLQAADVMMFELVASGICLLVAWTALTIHLCRLRKLPAPENTWQPPARKTMQRLALQAYGSYVLALAYSPQVLTLLIARLLGADAAGLYGFARTFTDQVRRYLPTDLLQSVLRPALVALHGRTGDFAALALRLQLWCKSSVIVLLPLLAFFSLAGEQGAVLIGGPDFGASWSIVVLMLLGAGMSSWRRGCEIACSVVFAYDLCLRASFFLLVVPLIVATVLWTSHKLLLAVAIPVLAEFWFCANVQTGLHRRGFAAKWQWHGFARAGLALLATLGALYPFREHFSVPLLMVAIALLGALILRISRPFEKDEAGLVEKWNPHVARIVGC